MIVILVDDLGWTDLACQGSEFYETPHADRLASEGLRFTDGYAGHPVCSPTRAAIMTGNNPVRKEINLTDWIPGQGAHKSKKVLAPKNAGHLPLEQVTIAEALKAAGYATWFCGKWHLGNKGFFPEDQGFDVNHGGHHKGSPPGGYYTPYKNPALDNGPEGEYLTDRLTDESIAFLEANREQPFLLYLSFYTVHTPIQACQRHIAYYEKKLAEMPEPIPGSPCSCAPRKRGTALGAVPPEVRPPTDSSAGGRVYSSTWMFLSRQMSLRICGHTVTLTSPICAFRSRYM